MMKTPALLVAVLLLVSCASSTPATKRTDPTKHALANAVSLQKEDGTVFCSGVVTERVILTAAHCTEVEFTIYASILGETFPVQIDKVWAAQDLAILTADRALGKGVPLAKNAPRYGDAVYVVGFPLGEFGLHVTRGVVSNPLVRTGIKKGQYVFYHDGATLRGNSGGPVLNKHGHILGVTSYYITQELDCPGGSCGGVYQDTSLFAATHLYVIRSFFGKRL